MKIVQVDWLDPCEDGPTWQTHGEAIERKPAECHSVGYLAHQDDERVVLCSTWIYDDDETVSRPLVIPAGCVVRVVEL
jgi:hypothetical protein